MQLRFNENMNNDKFIHHDNLHNLTIFLCVINIGKRKYVYENYSLQALSTILIKNWTLYYYIHDDLCDFLFSPKWCNAKKHMRVSCLGLSSVWIKEISILTLLSRIKTHFTILFIGAKSWLSRLILHMYFFSALEHK